MFFSWGTLDGFPPLSPRIADQSILKESRSDNERGDWGEMLAY